MTGEVDKVVKVLVEDFEQQVERSTDIEMKVLDWLYRLFGPFVSMVLFHPLGLLKIMKAAWRDVREEMK
jgi:hypothetical protein